MLTKLSEMRGELSAFRINYLLKYQIGFNS